MLGWLSVAQSRCGLCSRVSVQPHRLLCTAVACVILQLSCIDWLDGAAAGSEDSDAPYASRAKAAAAAAALFHWQHRSSSTPLCCSSALLPFVTHRKGTSTPACRTPCLILKPPLSVPRQPSLPMLHCTTLPVLFVRERADAQAPPAHGPGRVPRHDNVPPAPPRGGLVGEAMYNVPLALHSGAVVVPRRDSRNDRVGQWRA